MNFFLRFCSDEKREIINVKSKEINSTNTKLFTIIKVLLKPYTLFTACSIA